MENFYRENLKLIFSWHSQKLYIFCQWSVEDIVTESVVHYSVVRGTVFDAEIKILAKVRLERPSSYIFEICLMPVLGKKYKPFNCVIQIASLIPHSPIMRKKKANSSGLGCHRRRNEQTPIFPAAAVITRATLGIHVITHLKSNVMIVFMRP